MARTGYFKHKRHGGGKYRANSLLELHQWNYKRLFHRANQKSLLKSSPITRAIELQKKQRKQSAWQKSIAKKNLKTWRETKVRVGRGRGFQPLLGPLLYSLKLASSNWKLEAFGVLICLSKSGGGRDNM